MPASTGCRGYDLCQCIQKVGAHAGLVIGGLAWGLNTQLGQVLLYVDCALRLPLLAASSGMLLIIALAAGLWSLRGGTDGAPGTAMRFYGMVSGLSAALFGFALLLQTLSAVVLNPCAR